MATSRAALERLVEQARNDPKFFHGLIFEPEATLERLDYLSRRDKAMILGIEPTDVIAGLMGLIANPLGPVAECTNSCGNSCLDTCGGSCGSTCDSSCKSTCGADSCGHTTKIDFGEAFSRPGWAQFGGRQFFRQFQRYK
jgi:hypothetical protein